MSKILILLAIVVVFFVINQKNIRTSFFASAVSSALFDLGVGIVRLNKDWRQRLLAHNKAEFGKRNARECALLFLVNNFAELPASGYVGGMTQAQLVVRVTKVVESWVGKGVMGAEVAAGYLTRLNARIAD